MSRTVGQNEREVGRVVLVSNYKVTVLLDSAIHSQVRAYPHHIALITQIGGYLLFPVAPGESAVGIIVGASEDEGIEQTGDKSLTLQLAAARRTLKVNLLGQLLEKQPFIPGVSVYPTLETAALLPSEEELNCILEYHAKEDDKDKDIPLDLGTSPIYSHPVTVSFNDLLARPMGVIGNTGSGKSYSVASILQQALSAEGGAAKQAKFILLDINGEYRSAFPDENTTVSESRDLNTVYVDGKAFNLPLWSFNLLELVSFFQASQASQVPVLERVITLAREETTSSGAAAGLRKIVRLAETGLQHLDSLETYTTSPTAGYVGQKVLSVLKHVEATINNLIVALKPKAVTELAAFATQATAIRSAGIKDHDIPPGALSIIVSTLESYKEVIAKIRDETMTAGGLTPITADMPIPFETNILLKDLLFHTVVARFRGQERIQEYVATLRLRIHRQLADKRWNVFTGSSPHSFLQLLQIITGGEDRRVVVIDCSMLAHDVLPFFCAIVGRLLLELRARSEPSKRTVQPYCLVLEEAHNYLKPNRQEESDGLRLAREAFERIAKEGRKFGLSLIIASQRPADVSATVLSQCANFLVHRIQNPEDIDYFKKILPIGSRDMLDQLPILSPGDGLLLGSAVNVPARIKVQKPKPTPRSDTPSPWLAWQASQPKLDVASALSSWILKEMKGVPAEKEKPKKREGK